MAPKIFLTGATGYIGGDAFYTLYNAHPEYEYTLLVRDSTRGALVAAKYPSVKLVYGDLNSSDVISAAAAAADVVVHTANSADDVPSTQAIVKGLTEGHSADKPGFYIHVSGTGILTWYDLTHKRWGQPPLPDQKYDDLAGVESVVTLPDQAPHRNVDKIVLAANSSPGVRTAIVAPPTIYGAGRGPANQRSIQAPELVDFALKKGYAPAVETGLTEWDNVHVHDLSQVFLALVEAALDPARNADPQLFGDHAYFFAENGVHVWGEVARWVAEEAHRQGFIEEPKVVKTGVETVTSADVGQSGITWAANSKGVANRARKFLGWKPTGKGLKEEIADLVASEAKRLGITAKYSK